MAFSISSASIRTRSLTTAGATVTFGGTTHVDAGVVLDLTERQPDHVDQRQRARPARRPRPSRRARRGCRRCGAAGWTRGRAGTGAAAGRGSVSSRSSRSMSATCRATRFCVRRPTWPNICATLRRLATCRSTRPAAVPCTRSNARASSPISSLALTSTASRWIGPVASASSSATRTSSASATRATRSADAVSRVSGRTTARATARLSRTTTSRISRARPPMRYATVSALRRSLSTTAVTSLTILFSTSVPTLTTFSRAGKSAASGICDEGGDRVGVERVVERRAELRDRAVLQLLLIQVGL